MVSVIVKRPVLPLCVLDGRSRNPLYYYYYYCSIAENVTTSCNHQYTMDCSIAENVTTSCNHQYTMDCSIAESVTTSCNHQYTMDCGSVDIKRDNFLQSAIRKGLWLCGRHEHFL